MPEAKPLFLLRPGPLWLERFTQAITDEGGFADLERDLQAAFLRENTGLIPVDDYETYRRIKLYAAYPNPGMWQKRFLWLAQQMPDGLEDPQGSLF